MNSNKSEQEICIGFIGAGNHATWTLYPSLQYFPKVKLISVCDLDEKRAEAARRRFGAERKYSDYQEMIEKENLDALLCCSGPKLHSEVALAAIDRKIPLFLEKPPASNSEIAKEIALSAKKNNAKVMVAFMHRFSTIVSWAKRAIDNPEFGNVMMLSAKEGIWATPAETLVLDSGIHHIDLLRYLGGELNWLIASSSSDGDKRHGFAVHLNFLNGIVGSLDLNSLESLATPSDTVSIYGNKGQWILLYNWEKATWYRDPTINSEVYFSPLADPKNSTLVYEHSWTGAGINKSIKTQGYVDEMAHFFKCIEEDIQPSPNLWDGYKGIQIVEAINKSAKSGEKIFIK